MDSVTEPRWEPIEYAAWYDFPRVFAVRDGDRVLVLEPAYEKVLDEHGPFRVCEFDADEPGAPDDLKGWLKVKRDPAKQVGSVPGHLGRSMFSRENRCRLVRVDMIREALERSQAGGR